MKVCWEGFLASNHSWSVVGQNISRALVQLGHQVDLFSTNGIKDFPEDLKPLLIGYGEGLKIHSGQRPVIGAYDMSLSYTAMINFPYYLKHSTKNRFGIWAYEFDGRNALPNGFAKNHTYCDLILAPSLFTKEVFINSGIPANKIIIIPHGINIEEIEQAKTFSLKTNKTHKILINLGQLHKRKNIEGSLEIFGRAFNKNDDVCLILKIQDKIPSQQFEINFSNVFSKFIKKFPNHAEIEIIKDYIPNIYSLYKSCNVIFSASFCEGFGMTHLEGMACGLTPVAPRYGGFLDFMNDENSFLINGKIFNAPPDFLYYQHKIGTIAFRPDIDDGVQKLRAAIAQSNILNQSKASIVKQHYSWTEIGKKILQLIK